MDFRDLIRGIHLWGKKSNINGRFTSHVGNLDTYFQNKELKEVFLKEIFNLLNDGKSRYFVPEVNSSEENLQSIVKDMIDVGYKFI